MKEGGPYPSSSTCDSQLKDELEYKTWLAGESQVEEDMNSMDKLLQCDEIMDSSTLSSNFLLRSGPSNPISRNNINDVVPQGNNNSSSGIAELENLELDTPPDFQFSVSIDFISIVTVLLCFLFFFSCKPSLSD